MLYDVIGPVMIGPSSSHTAGMVKLGRAFHYIFNGKIEEIYFYLNEQLFSTYKGHGSDRALLGGIMGINESDESLIYSIDMAKDKGIKYKFICTNFPGKHPNTVKIIGKNKNKTLSMEGCSIGGSSVIIKMIQNQKVNIIGIYPSLIIKNRDVPGALASILYILRKNDVNISNLSLIRSDKIKKTAICVIELDNKPSPIVIECIEKLKNVLEISFMPKLEVNL